MVASCPFHECLFGISLRNTAISHSHHTLNIRRKKRVDIRRFSHRRSEHWQLRLHRYISQERYSIGWVSNELRCKNLLFMLGLVPSSRSHDEMRLIRSDSTVKHCKSISVFLRLYIVSCVLPRKLWRLAQRWCAPSRVYHFSMLSFHRVLSYFSRLK